MQRDIAITGMGIVSSIGDGLSDFGAALESGKSGIRRMDGVSASGVSVDIAADIRDFSFMERLRQFQGMPDSMLNAARRLGRRAPFTIQTSIISALQAWQQAGLCTEPADRSRIDPDRIGLIIAGQNTTQNYQYALIPKFKATPEYLSPRYALEFMDSNQIGVLSELLGIQGEGFVVGGASATGNVGIIKGAQAISQGRLDICLVVGVLADLSPMDIQGFVNIGALGGKVFRDDPEKACRPFDVRHEGFIYGQAGAGIVLESRAGAARRGGPVHACLKGAAMNLDGNSSADPSVNGEVKAMLSALQQSGMRPEDIDYINTHGTSSPLGDKTEAAAINRAFKDCTSGPWLNATKGLTGHCLYSAGVVEVIATVVQMTKGFIHPNKNLETPIDSALKFCGSRAVRQPIATAISNSFGFGGINTSIVLKREPK